VLGARNRWPTDAPGCLTFCLHSSRLDHTQLQAADYSKRRKSEEQRMNKILAELGLSDIELSYRWFHLHAQLSSFEPLTAGRLTAQGLMATGS